MASVVEGLFSWGFVLGLVVGFCLQRGWHMVRAMWLNKHYPLSGGRRRSCSPAVDMQRFAAVVMVGVVAWSVYKTSDNANDTSQLAADAQTVAKQNTDCQNELITAINRSREVTKAVNAESAKQRDALADWLRTLLSPPPEIRALPGDDPARQQWAIGVTTAYFNLIERSQRDQAAADAKRPELPEPNCDR